MIYFDSAATSGHKPRNVKKIVNVATKRLNANPGRSGHDASLKIAKQVFEVREKIKKFFNAKNYQVIFTKNCTEALNLAIFGFLNSGDHVIISCYEHNSVLRPINSLKEKGVELTILDCDLRNLLNQIKLNIKSNTKLVITTMISNVTGEQVDCENIGKYLKIKNVTYLLDCAQSAGHELIDLEKINADMIAFAGHKGLLAITGVGALVIKNNIKLKPILLGGTGSFSGNLSQPNDIPDGFEAGTIPVIPILSLGSGIDYIGKNFSKISKKEAKLHDFLIKSLKNLKFLKIYSDLSCKNICLFNMQNISSGDVANMLNEQYSICVRAGLHCAPLAHKYIGTYDSGGAVRISIDFTNSKKEINNLVYALKNIYNQLNSRK